MAKMITKRKTENRKNRSLVHHSPSGALRLFFVLAFLSLSLGACESLQPRTAEQYPQNFKGGVIADEPNAALIGQSILAAGGNAADAITAMGFGLAVTRPSSVGLGAAGVCLASDPETGNVDILTFIPPAAPATNRNQQQIYLLPPALPAGLAALHGRYGSVDWRRVLLPAERLARDGYKVSRAFASEITLMEPGHSARPLITTSNGTPLAEGNFWKQPALARTLQNLRLRGGIAFLHPRVRDQMFALVPQSGVRVRRSDWETAWNGLRPQWTPSLAINFDSLDYHTVRHPSRMGIMQLQAWQDLLAEDRYEDADPENRPALIKQAWQRVLAGVEQWQTQPLDNLVAESRLVGTSYYQENLAPLVLSEEDQTAGNNPGTVRLASSSLMALDERGQAIACSLGLLQPFGGAYIPTAGISLASIAQPDHIQALDAPAIILTRANRRLRMISSGLGSTPQAGLSVIADVLLGDTALPTAIDNLDQHDFPVLFPGPGGKPAFADCPGGIGGSEGGNSSALAACALEQTPQSLGLSLRVN